MKKVSLPVYSGSGGDVEQLVPLRVREVQDASWREIVRVIRAKSSVGDSGPLRTSSYVIQVELPEDPGSILLVHGYTGAYDRVSRRVSDYLRALESKSNGSGGCGAGTSPLISSSTIEQLERRGHLTRMTRPQELEFFKGLVTSIHGRSLRSRPAYVVMPTYQCNLRCPYCFQDHMRRDSRHRHLLRTMEPDMVDRILSGVRQIDNAHGILAEFAPKKQFILFGGEPLLAESRHVVEYFLRRAKELGPVGFSAVSNATELDEYEDLLGPDGISNIQITIDGSPTEHDRRRVYADGSGSFAKIAANIDLALGRDVAVSVRMNIDRGNVGSIREIAQEIISRGWHTRPRFSAYAAKVDAINGRTETGATFDSWQLDVEIASLAEEDPNVAAVIQSDKSLLQRSRSVVVHGADPLGSFRASFCAAHDKMYVFDAFGDIYACWERTGDPALRIGTITEAGEVMVKRSTMERWRGRHVASNPVCAKCRYASYCGGGCAAMAEDRRGDMYTNFCDSFAKRFRASVAQAYMEKRLGGELAADGPACSVECK